MILAQRRLEEIAKSSGRVIDERVRSRTKACITGTIGQTDIPTHGGLDGRPNAGFWLVPGELVRRKAVCFWQRCT